MYQDNFTPSNDELHNIGIFRAIIDEIDLGGQSVLDLIMECTDGKWCDKDAIEHIMERAGFNS